MSNDDITERAAAENRRAWDSFRHQRDAGLVDDRRDPAGDILAGKRLLRDEYLRLAGAVAGKRLLDLGCGDGAELLEWGRLGASVVGVDNSPVQLATAQRNSERLGVPCRLLHADLLRLPEELLRGEFDVVYSAWVLSWIGDLGRWFGSVRRALKAGGVFVLGGMHALGYFCLEHQRGNTEWTSYFDRGPYIEQVGASHRWNPAGEAITTIEWGHTLGDVVTAACQSGLRLTNLIEMPEDDWGIAGGPGEFVLRAVKD